MKDVLRPAAVRMVQDNLTLVDTINRQLEALEKIIPVSPEEEHAICLLMNIPGIRRTIATTVVAETDDIAHFDPPKSLWIWLA
jgi:transposase